MSSTDSLEERARKYYMGKECKRLDLFLFAADFARSELEQAAKIALASPTAEIAAAAIRAYAGELVNGK